jgi:hypothetical protein
MLHPLLAPSGARRIAGSLLALVLTAPNVLAGPRSELDASAGLRPAASLRAVARTASANSSLLKLATPASYDERYAVPTFLWATRTGAPIRSAAARVAKPSAEGAARQHLGLLSNYYRLQAADVAQAPMRYVHDTGRGGIIVAFRQEVAGIEVFRDEVKVLMDRDFGLVAVSGYIPSRDLVSRTAAPQFQITAERALGIALDDFAGQPASGTGVLTSGVGEGGYLNFDVVAATSALPEGLQPGGPVRVKPTLFHLPDALVPAYSIELLAPDQAYLYVVSASDGALLFRHDIMAFDSFNYRVWAQTTGVAVPFDGPQGSAPTPHPTGLPDFFAPPFVAPGLLALQNGPLSTNDPWLPPGASVTTGNNVDAYADLSTPDGFSLGDLRASTTAPNTFDRTYDVNLSPSVSSDQRMASVTQLFYDNNFFHDWYYDSGFDEASGNGQTNNFGRGGLGADAMRSEAQDFGGTNNANMSTPADGAPGRMQMYVFNQAGSQLTVNTPPSLAGNYGTGLSTTFGPQTFTLTGNLVLAVDNAAPTGDGCSTIGAAVAGKIAVIDRGICGFGAKVLNAQTAGAIGVIIVDNIAGVIPPALGGTGAGVSIPSLSVTLATGNLLKAELLNGPVSVTLTRLAVVGRDGTLDNQIVAHEWGHFISNRLVGNAAGLSSNMSGGLGEGWGDFHAMMITVRAEDIGVTSNSSWQGVFGLAGYALYPASGLSNAYYFGIRRVPYSTDFTKNALTFKHIQNGIALPVGPPTRSGADGANNAEVHNTGEVWCTMLWECYAGLLRDTPRLTFAQAQQRMRDYLVASYKLTPNAPTLLEARDALLAAAYVADLNDFNVFWQAFAKRGAGAGAIAPGRFDVNNATVVESFVTGGDLAVVSKSLDVGLHSCDLDGHLDNGEIGHVFLALKNTGSVPLTATTVTLSSTNPHVSFPGGTTWSFPSLAPFFTATVAMPVELLGASGLEVVDVVMSYNDPALALGGPRTTTFFAYGNCDEVPSTIESVEALSPPWAATGTPLADGQWFTYEVGALDHRFNGPDFGDVADHTLTSPPLQIAATGAFTFSFQHAFDFERDATNFYDGGVVELSNNGGASWTDIGASLSTAYGGTLFSGSGNPLAGRPGYVGRSSGYPALLTTTANLGATYLGQTVRVRFRIATDAGVGAAGWDLATLTFNNLVNQPFLALAANATDCTPVAVESRLPSQVAFTLASANPATGSMRFRYGLPQSAVVQMAIYDVTGRRVATLADGEQDAGWHALAWTTNDDGSAPASGVYFARFAANGRVLTARLAMMK